MHIKCVYYSALLFPGMPLGVTTSSPCGQISHEGRCYTFRIDSHAWSGAEAICASLSPAGQHLVTIGDVDKQSFVVQ